MRPQMIMKVLAELAPAGDERPLDVTRGGQPLVWLTDPDRAPRSAGADRLAALDALRADERVLRRGWGFVIGTAEIAGTRRRIRHPLLTQPIRLERGLRGYRVAAAGDLELSPLIEDRELAASLESAPGLGGAAWLAAVGTRAWLLTAASAAGFPAATVHPGPPPKRPDDTLVTAAAAGLFTAREGNSAGLRETLLTWAGRPLEGTAFAAVHGSVPAGADDIADPDEAVLSPLPLGATQREVVRRARTEPVTVVSGPPGTGKSHAVVAAAVDVVDRGGSVLIATQSPHATEVLAALLRRYPGPTPVLFGDAERREAIATELAGGTPTGISERHLRQDAEAVRAVLARHGQLLAGIVSTLELERRAASAAAAQPLLPALRSVAPGAFEPGFDLDRALALARPATSGDGRWARGRWAQGRAAVATARLRRAVRAAGGTDLDQIRAALAAAEAIAAVATLATCGGTDLGAAWATLFAVERELAAAVGTAIGHRARSAERWSTSARRAASALATALRAGRNRRREMLATLGTGRDGRALVEALPLWVGTVTDVEDLLPQTPGLFDLVILDEAVHIDQLRAAPVLARARRALVVGDPRQLRFVSFVSDVDIAATLARNGAAHLANRLDVRRVSAFDIAAGSTAVTWLDEHHRSVPHLIGFSAERCYGGRLSVMTRCPATERTDAIEVLRVAGASCVDGVNQAEVDVVVSTVRRLAADPEPRPGGIAVITPFRAQADAIETALLAAFDVAEIERLGLRSGTVHAFQGGEADVVVASLGLVDDDAPGRQRFLADGNLFNVLITRARRRMVVVTSLTEPGGIVGAYLEYAAAAGAPADPTPTRTGAVGGDPEWRSLLAAELDRAGIGVLPGYRIGRWRVDLCLDLGDDAPERGGVGLICGVHPDGAAAHVERQRVLHAAGWRLHDAFASRWDGDPVRAAVEIVGAVRVPVTADRRTG